MQQLLLGGHPLLDFLNTLYGPGGQEVEVIGNGQAYVGWFIAAGLIDKEEAAALVRRATGKALDAAAAEARKIREWARGWLERWRANPRGDYRKEIAALNELLERQATRRKLVRTKGELTIVESAELESAAALIGLIAGQLAALLTNERAELVKTCAGPSCTLWFVDRTKAHRRVFCSAAACGNRARVAAFRQRQLRANLRKTGDSQ
jgi:predicted RNA-binding Zn ribbon-like protein